MTKEQEIQKHMQVLGLTREQAEQLWEDDNSDFVSEEMAEMERKAKANRRYEQSDKPRAKAKKKVKIDEEKVRLMELFNYCLLEPDRIDDELPFKIEFVSVVNDQKEITFSVGENEYSLVLTKHRPKKQPKGYFFYCVRQWAERSGCGRSQTELRIIPPTAHFVK